MQCVPPPLPLHSATETHGEILGFETQPLVSTDYINDVRSTIVDAASTMVVQARAHCQLDTAERIEHG